MKPEDFRLPNKLELLADHLFSHRLRLAEREFADLANQVFHQNLGDLTRDLSLTVGGKAWELNRVSSGAEIFKFRDEEHHVIVHFLPKKLFADDQMFYLLILPELDENERVVGLSLGFAKHDGDQFFTGWMDSQTQLTARRQNENIDYLWMIQKVYCDDLYKQLEKDKDLGLSFRFKVS